MSSFEPQRGFQISNSIFYTQLGRDIKTVNLSLKTRETPKEVRPGFFLYGTLRNASKCIGHPRISGGMYRMYPPHWIGLSPFKSTIGCGAGNKEVVKASP